MTNYVFWNKDSGHSVETGLEGEKGSQHTAVLEEIPARGVFERLDFEFENLDKAEHLRRQNAIYIIGNKRNKYSWSTFISCNIVSTKKKSRTYVSVESHWSQYRVPAKSSGPRFES